MFSAWLSSWYNGNNVQQQAFINSYEQQQRYEETTTTVEGDWVEIISSSTEKLEEQPIITSKVLPITTIDSTINHDSNKINTNSKPLSRQERRAKARLALREEKKQARKTAMALKRSNTRITAKGLSSSTSTSSCLPSTPLTTTN
ncbi:uncharacterized protein BX663DRAFT_550479 [Cokeromyces recurvatus]|uniref:uncharacterized protein n=1 Tax=Cokeromyces recurvatus TaxID=90255 RepID=UPI00221F22D7|nr:uncharacterized protein BX663DRAFT_550479 [Cokeromyces recurvatus]KAI7904850.1 hypothetical protein BX663DRAFT_550479 [Cokeromyces recurvatus]